MALVEIRQLEVLYGAHPAVRGVDLDVEAGRLTALVGPSGCGKTSLLRAIAGFETPTAGAIHLDGECVAGPGAWVAPERRRVGMVFQQGALFPHMTVRQNVLYGLAAGAEREGRALEALELVGMADRRDRFPDQLSGGEQQRVALARALAPRPRLVLLDEPFASLDAILRRRLREEMRAILEAERITAILVTHDQEEALSIAGTVAVMIDGEIHQHGRPAEIYRRPADLAVARFVGDGQLLACEVADGTARSVLGEIPCATKNGAAWMLVHPEDIELLPEGSPDGRSGHLLRRSFFGHDQLDEVELDDGTVVKVRVLSAEGYRVAEKVKARLKERDFAIYAADDEGLSGDGESAPGPTSGR